MGRRLVEELEVEITRQGLPWRSRWRKGYVAFQRPGGYNVLQVAPGTAIPDVRGVVDLARAHQPEQGAFKAVTLPITEDDPTPRATEPSN